MYARNKDVTLQSKDKKYFGKLLGINEKGELQIQANKKVINIIRITESDSIVSVLEEREPMFNYSQNGLTLINPGRFQDLTFDKERLYKFNGSIIAVWWEILESNNLFGEKISYLEMTQEDSLQLTSQSMLDNFKK